MTSPDSDAARIRGSVIGNLSKGYQQRVGIAQAIIHDPELVVLDEPTSGLDPKASNEFSALLQELQADGAAILMATHDLFRAKETGTRIGIMREGELVQELKAEEGSHADLERIYLEHMH